LHNNMGLSVIICCHNSSRRIGKVLEALAEQVLPNLVKWEVVVVNNASTDDTAEVVKQKWSELNTGIELTIANEPIPGLSNARNKGIATASFEYLIFCDDDNWLFRDYLQKVLAIFESNNNICACGGLGIPVFEKEKPWWFDDYAECFATGSQEITREDGKLLNLYGAGMAVRKSCYEWLERAGFNPHMTGRKGEELSSSEDTEFTYALVLLNKELYYSDKLKFYHFMPAERMQLTYLKKLFKAFGNDGPLRNLYYANISIRPFHQKLNKWSIHLLLALVRLVKYLLVPPKKAGRIIYFNWSLSYIRSLFAIRPVYSELKNDIKKLREMGLKKQGAIPKQNAIIDAVR